MERILKLFAYILAVPLLAQIPVTSQTQMPICGGSVTTGCIPKIDGSGNLELPGNVTATGSLTARNLEVSVLDAPYSAKCDWNGTAGTDDSVALQAAITAAQVAQSTLVLPVGMCSYGTTLNITGAIQIRGLGKPWGYPGHGSALAYTGTGKALNVQASGAFVYRVVLRDFGVFSTTGTATHGIYADSLSEFSFERLQVGWTNYKFGTGIYCTGCTIGVIAGNALSKNTRGIVFDNGPGHNTSNGTLAIRENNIWASSGAGIVIGNLVGSSITSNHLEQNQVAILIDNNSGAEGEGVASSAVDIETNVVLTDGDVTQPRFIKVISTQTGNPLIADYYTISNNTVGFPASGATFAIELILTGNLDTAHTTRWLFRSNRFSGVSTSGIYADTASSDGVVIQNRTGASGLAEDKPQVSGSGAFRTEYTDYQGNVALSLKGTRTWQGSGGNWVMTAAGNELSNSAAATYVKAAHDLNLQSGGGAKTWAFGEAGYVYPPASGGYASADGSIGMTGACGTCTCKSGLVVSCP